MTTAAMIIIIIMITTANRLNMMKAMATMMATPAVTQAVIENKGGNCKYACRFPHLLSYYAARQRLLSRRRQYGPWLG